ncbi:siphovirus Gp157 family protein [Komagataeibacter oboediens]|uniref:siphovirus Gp157 family protein n=1 Tax=Komagataeibacter oboediens TaxID=65958 RepID=UPI000237E3C2|nr:siphovirus Gp157 family protein [Komagataeibacter oboediens]
MADLAIVMDRIYVEQIAPAIKALNASRVASKAPDANMDQIALEQIAMLELWSKESEVQAKALRSSLTGEMEDTGILAFESKHFTGSLAASPQTATVTDEKALRAARPDLFEPQPDKLNRAKLTKALKRGEQVEGATLSNGGAMRLVIRGKKGIAA